MTRSHFISKLPSKDGGITIPVSKVPHRPPNYDTVQFGSRQPHACHRGMGWHRFNPSQPIQTTRMRLEIKHHKTRYSILYIECCSYLGISCCAQCHARIQFSRLTSDRTRM